VKSVAKIVLVKRVSKISQKSSIIIGAFHLAIRGHMSHDSPSSAPKIENCQRCRQQCCTLISGFHRALLESITFIRRLNALSYTKLTG